MIEVRPIPTGATYDLRRRVLRAGTPSHDVSYPQDELPGTIHLGAFDLEVLCGVSTWTPEAWSTEPNQAGVRLRGMAVEVTLQRGGHGRALLDEGVARAATAGAEFVWATARDSALGFYRRAGFVVVGAGFEDDATALAHHLVVHRFA